MHFICLTQCCSVQGGQANSTSLSTIIVSRIFWVPAQVVAPLMGLTPPPTSHQDSFSNLSKFNEKILGIGVRDLQQDFKMSVETKSLSNFRVWHTNSPSLG